MKVEKKMWEIRKKKLESLLKEQISILIQKGEIKDPRINSFVIVTGADITRDLKYAKIFISYSGNLRARENVVKVLNNAAGFIQGRLSKRVRLRYTPHLKFHSDNSINNAQKINDLLASINKSNKPDNNETALNKEDSV